MEPSQPSRVREHDSTLCKLRTTRRLGRRRRPWGRREVGERRGFPGSQGRANAVAGKKKQEQGQKHQIDKPYELNHLRKTWNNTAGSCSGQISPAPWLERDRLSRGGQTLCATQTTGKRLPSRSQRLSIPLACSFPGRSQNEAVTWLNGTTAQYEL